MCTKIRWLQLPIENHLGISRESSSFWVLPTTIIDLIPDFAKVAAPISSLLSNQKELNWTPK